MAADDAARSSRRMDLNLYLGLPRAPPARRPDLGSDLALGTPMLSSSSASSSAASADAPPPDPDMEQLHPPYSPSRADLVRPPTPAHEPYDPEAHPPYVPPPLPVPEAIPELADDLMFGFSHQLLPPLQPSELLRWVEHPSSSTASSSSRLQRRLRPRLELGEEANRGVIRLNSHPSRYFGPRRFRSNLPPLNSDAPSLENDAAAQPLEPEEPVHDTVEENKVVADGAIVDISEDEGKERGKSSSMFECNICFEMAAEPVVTSCGHLFCWPCLYQWLHVHSTHKECPVCKGEVTEGNITPIYGRGNSGSDMEKKVAEDGNASGPKIPPRPHGNRLESFRQQFHHLRPISRRLGEAHGILSSWRRLLDEQQRQQFMNNVSRFEGPPQSAAPDIAQHASRLGRITTRMRARLQREAENPTAIASSAPDSELPGNNTSNPPRRASSPFSSQGMDLLRRLALADSEGLATAVSDLIRIARPNQYGASTSNQPNPEPVDGIHVAAALAADQASNSSTMAVIQEDAAFTESAGEPSNAGSSRSLRRGRSDAMGSLDVDGGDLHRYKRRRLN